MRWMWGLVPAATVSAALAAAGGAGGAARPPCGPEDAETIARSAGARVFVDNRVRGCVTGAAPVDLEYAADFHRDQPVRLAGGKVAYVADYEANAGDFGQDVVVPAVRVADLRSGRRLVDMDVDHEDKASFVHGMVLRPTGGVAWITIAKVQRASPKDPAKGTFHWRILDTRPGLDAHSLRLRGIKLSWVREGRRKRANLR